MLDTSQTEAPEKKSPAPEEDTNPFKITEAEQAQVTDTKPADLKTEDDDVRLVFTVATFFVSISTEPKDVCFDEG